jgi:hypothetical protein
VSEPAEVSIEEEGRIRRRPRQGIAGPRLYLVPIIDPSRVVDNDPVDADLAQLDVGDSGRLDDVPETTGQLKPNVKGAVSVPEWEQVAGGAVDA